MNIGQRLDASLDCTLEGVGGVGLRKIDGRLHGREQVLAAMLRFSGQRGNFFLIALLLGNIPRDLGGADDLALGIFDGGNSQ